MPTMPDWQLQNPLDAVIFDCDGTLSSIEGIDELAKMNDCGPVVESLTADAMSHSGINPDLYNKRLQLVLPTRQQVLALGSIYQSTLVPDAKAVIQILQRLNKTVFLVSAGFKLALEALGKTLNIPANRIFAVDIQFTPEGDYHHFDTTSPLTHPNGKREIAEQLKHHYPALAHIGDGINDFIAHDLVTRFIGYGGVFYRENIAAGCQFYITSRSLAAVLPLTLTQTEVAMLTPAEMKVYEQGYNDLIGGMVVVSADH